MKQSVLKSIRFTPADWKLIRVYIAQRRKSNRRISEAACMLDLIQMGLQAHAIAERERACSSTGRAGPEPWQEWRARQRANAE